MTLELGPELEAILALLARQKGVTIEEMALYGLKERLLPSSEPPAPPRDDWERRLREAATDCGVSLSNWAVSRDSMYE